MVVTIPVTKLERQEARWKIIQEVNKHIMRQRAPVFQAIPVLDKDHFQRTGRRSKLMVTSYFREPKLIGMKDIQRAVNIARRFNLVSAGTLWKAGYRAG